MAGTHYGGHRKDRNHFANALAASAKANYLKPSELSIAAMDLYSEFIASGAPLVMQLHDALDEAGWYHATLGGRRVDAAAVIDLVHFGKIQAVDVAGGVVRYGTLGTDDPLQFRSCAVE